MAKLVSKTYGEALFQIILEKEEQSAGSGVELYTEMCGLMEILRQNPDFDRLMMHPGIAKTEKLDAVRRIFRGRTSPELSEFLQLLVTKDRYRELTGIMEYVSEKMREYQRIGVAYISTATVLSEAQKEQVQRRLLETTSYESLELHYDVDPELIGGMVIRIGDRVVDTSVRTRLNEMTKQLLKLQLQ